MVMLDFRNCKTPEDVRRVFEQKEPELSQIHRIIEKTQQLTEKELELDPLERKHAG